MFKGLSKVAVWKCRDTVNSPGATSPVLLLPASVLMWRAQGLSGFDLAYAAGLPADLLEGRASQGQSGVGRRHASPSLWHMFARACLGLSETKW